MKDNSHLNEENDQVISLQNKWLVLGHMRDKVRKRIIKNSWTCLSCRLRGKKEL